MKYIKDHILFLKYSNYKGIRDILFQILNVISHFEKIYISSNYAFFPFNLLSSGILIFRKPVQRTVKSLKKNMNVNQERKKEALILIESYPRVGHNNVDLVDCALR